MLTLVKLCFKKLQVSHLCRDWGIVYNGRRNPKIKNGPLTYKLLPTPLSTRRLTAEVRSVRQTGDDSLVACHHVDDALLDEVHLVADRSVSDDNITGQENLELQVGDNVRNEIVVSVREERNGGDQRSTVEIDDFLQQSTHASI